MIYYVWQSNGKEVTTPTDKPPSKYANLLTTYYTVVPDGLGALGGVSCPSEPQPVHLQHGSRDWDDCLRWLKRKL